MCVCSYNHIGGTGETTSAKQKIVYLLGTGEMTSAGYFCPAYYYSLPQVQAIRFYTEVTSPVPDYHNKTTIYAEVMSPVTDI